MDVIIWLIVIAVVLVVAAVAFVAVRARQRSGDVVASSPVRKTQEGTSP